MPCSLLSFFFARGQFTRVWLRTIRRVWSRGAHRQSSVHLLFWFFMNFDIAIHRYVVFIDRRRFWGCGRWWYTVCWRARRRRRWVALHRQLSIRRCPRKQRRCLRLGNGFTTAGTVSGLSGEFNWKEDRGKYRNIREWNGEIQFKDLVLRPKAETLKYEEHEENIDLSYNVPISFSLKFLINSASPLFPLTAATCRNNKNEKLVTITLSLILYSRCSFGHQNKHFTAECPWAFSGIFQGSTSRTDS